VAQTGSMVSGVAARYARSLFELAEEAGATSATEKDLGRFEALLEGSADLRRLIESPVFSSEEQQKAIGAVLDGAKIGGLTGNFLRVVAKNRRLFAVPQMIRAFREIAADARGEATAEVTAAHALTADQEQALKAALNDLVGKDVTVKVTVDPSLLGGLVVRVGSRQIDTSLKTKLNSLKVALKEVG